jgi:hypothetical protein
MSDSSLFSSGEPNDGEGDCDNSSATGMHDLLVEVARERDEDRDHFLDACRTAVDFIAKARRELWWFIEHGEDEIDSQDAAARAIRIQDDLLAPAIEALRGSPRPLPAPGMTDLMVAPESIDAFLAENPPPKEEPSDV